MQLCWMGDTVYGFLCMPTCDVVGASSCCTAWLDHPSHMVSPSGHACRTCVEEIHSAGREMLLSSVSIQMSRVFALHI